MATLSFKAQDEFKKTLKQLADQAGINMSAYIKLLLTKSVKEELSKITENGLTVAEELEILARDEEEVVGPFESVAELRKSLES